MDKKKVRFFNLRINAEEAIFENLSIGPNLSPFMNKDKITQFCNEFNHLTNIFISKDIPIFVKLYLYTDNSFFFIIKGPSFSFLLKILFNITSLSDLLWSNNKISIKELYDIVILKNYYLNKYIKSTSFILRQQIRNCFFSIKGLDIDTS